MRPYFLFGIWVERHVNCGDRKFLEPLITRSEQERRARCIRIWNSRVSKFQRNSAAFSATCQPRMLSTNVRLRTSPGFNSLKLLDRPRNMQDIRTLSSGSSLQMASPSNQSHTHCVWQFNRGAGYGRREGATGRPATQGV